MTPEELQDAYEELKKKFEALELLVKRQFNSSTGTVQNNSFSNLEVFVKPIRVSSGTAPTPGGKIGVFFGSGNFGIYYGSGVPTITAGKGSLYLRTDGSSTSTRAYINSDGATTWTAITTAA